MNPSAFDLYGELALEQGRSDTERSGRYAFMEGQIESIVADVVEKLRLTETDDFLEIGFGPGLLLEPLSRLVQSAWGVDHPAFAEQFERKYQGTATLVGADFLSLHLGSLGKFDKILVYSVLHCLSSPQEVANFVQRAISLLKPGGRMLIGDIPNLSTKSRFLQTTAGKSFEVAWSKRVEATGGKQLLRKSEGWGVEFNDQNILEIVAELRSSGFEAHLLPQPVGLPFSKTREDIVARAWDG